MQAITNGRGVYCLTIGALQIDEAVERAVLAALAPIGVEAAIAAAEAEAIVRGPTSGD